MLAEIHFFIADVERHGARVTRLKLAEHDYGALFKMFGHPCGACRPFTVRGVPVVLR